MIITEISWVQILLTDSTAPTMRKKSSTYLNIWNF